MKGNKETMLAMIEDSIERFGLGRDRVVSWVQRAWGVADLKDLPWEKLLKLSDKIYGPWYDIVQEERRAAAAAKTKAAGERAAPPKAKEEIGKEGVGGGG